MKGRRKLRTLLRGLRRRHAARSNQDALREFVYLDDVSVYSLLASRVGAIASEFTDIERQTLQGDAATSVSAGTAPIARAEASSKISASQSRETRVVRKSIIQTSFRELYGYEKGSLWPTPPQGESPPSSFSSLEQFDKALSKLKRGNWVVSPSEFRRGQLLELGVLLEAESLFKINAVASAMLDMLDGSPEMFASLEIPDLAQIRGVMRVLRTLLVGLIPVRGRALDYEVFCGASEEWIVHKNVAAQMDATLRTRLRPLFVAGVTDEMLYWKDTRRILYSSAQYHVFCRLGRDGIHKSWNPVKLTDVLEEVAPAIGKQIRALGEPALKQMSEHIESAQGEARRSHIALALLGYAKLLDQHFELGHSETTLLNLDILPEQSLAAFDTYEQIQQAFANVAGVLEVPTDETDDRLAIARYRAKALEDAGLDFEGEPLVTSIPRRVTELETDKERFLDTEVVAIYW